MVVIILCYNLRLLVSLDPCLASNVPVTGYILSSSIDYRGDRSYKPNPRLARVLDILFILHAEHEMNCSTAAARHLASRYLPLVSDSLSPAALRCV